MVAEVLVEYNNKTLDKTFDYLVPFNLENKLKVGHKVKVEFGKTYVEGFVLKIKNELDEKVKYKKIINIVNEEFILNTELLKLGVYIKENTFCNLISAYSCMLPKALKAKNKVNINKKYINYLVLNKNINIEEYINNNKRNVAEIKVLNALQNTSKVLKKDFTLSSVKGLIKKGLISEVKEEDSRLKLNKSKKLNVTLTEKQELVYNEVNSSKGSNVFLLHGVTGSGKTEIYIKLISSMIKKGKDSILLVPEISLTPQIVDRFVGEFDNVAVLHSRLSEGEKYDEYRKILKGQVNIVIGARSAVFAPLKNLGLIIIDEEHSSSYKQESTPKYNAIQIAKERCKYNNCNLLLGSATPSLESYARAKKSVYKLLELTSRINNVKMPNVKLIDMNEEIKKRNFILSNELKEKINDRLKKQEQTILLLNRRGYSTFISCQMCGYVHKCPNCDISLTYHKTSSSLRCHYCGYTKTFSDVCPECKEKNMKNVGLGTEKLESVIKNEFKTAKVLRMDFDTTSKKGSHEKIINSFLNKEYDILLGTQMISKGLNFPNVTLVGIINSDATLNIPDFRSAERSFELYSQTSGRSGRNELPGEVLIQTFNTDSKVLNFVCENDYKGFFNYEMNIRKILKYPPYYYLTNIKIISNDYETASKEANKVLNYLNNNLTDDYIILGPTTAAMFKVNNKYHFSILIKYKNDTLLKKVLTNLNNIYKSNKVYIDIDNNPLNMI